ncbi:MAG: haloalkane dehalogenase [Marinobacter sp.]|nr:haloalkane dehalogenase [Marinobacter sp.]
MSQNKKFVTVHGRKIAYVETGNPDGDPIVFLHGNPTSSYLWRNVMPHLESLGRCIAPDLIGMGDSEKLPAAQGAGRYNFHVHYEFLRATLDALGVTENVTLVIHDWGSGLGFHWAYNHPDRVKRIAYMEAILLPVSWQDWPESARGIFQGFRSEKGEDLILNRNMFVEKVLPASVIRTLTEEEMEEYRRPFPKPEDRQPTLNWPRALPIEGEPVDMVKLVKDYGDWLRQSDLPKLFINAEPGSILVGKAREFCRSWPNQTEVTVKGLHFIQEDSPDEIGEAVARFVQSTGR